MKIIVTNNDYVKNKFEKDFEIIFVDSTDTYKPVLLKIRDLVHDGCVILTHPLSGSVKPNETPYKSVMMEKGKHLDEDSLKLIESSIATMDKFQGNARTPRSSASFHDDFKVIDLSIMEHTVLRLGHM